MERRPGGSDRPGGQPGRGSAGAGAGRTDAAGGRPAEGAGEPRLPVLPGFREMALRRMTAQRRQLVGELAAQRQAAGLSQTEVAARMGTSQSAVARLEASEADVRASTLERYAAAIGGQICWRLDPPPGRSPSGRRPA